MRSSFFKLNIAFIVGLYISLGFGSDAISTFKLGISILLGLASLFILKYRLKSFKLRWVWGLVALFVFSLFGIVRGQMELSKKTELNIEEIQRLSQQKNIIVIKLIESPKHLLAKQRVKANLYETNVNSTQLLGKVLLRWETELFNKSFIKLKKNDHLKLNAKLKLAFGPQNKEAFNYKEYLNNQNILGDIKIEKLNDIVSYSSSNNQLSELLNCFRNNQINNFFQYFNLEAARNILLAITLGEKSYLGSERKIFQDVGGSHVLAVSGMHVGILYLILIQFLRLIFRGNAIGKKVIRLIITLVFLWFYAIITGASPSVIRAVLMFSLFSIGMVFNRKGDFATVISVAAFFQLILNPNDLFNPGFQLSYLAVIGIVVFYFPLYYSIQIKSWFGDKLWQLTSMSIAAQILTFPIILYHFNFYSTVGVLSSFIIMPLAGFQLSSSLLFLCLSQLATFFNFLVPITELLVSLIELVFKLEYVLLEKLGNLNGATISFSKIGGIEIIFYFSLLGFIWNKISNSISRKFSVALACCCLLILGIKIFILGSNYNCYFLTFEKELNRTILSLNYKNENYQVPFDEESLERKESLKIRFGNKTVCYLNFNIENDLFQNEEKLDFILVSNNQNPNLLNDLKLNETSQILLDFKCNRKTVSDWEAWAEKNNRELTVLKTNGYKEFVWRN